jgi:hypothetical protein
VNPTGYWPYDYTYLRYYWYGFYPYRWYGYSPVPYEYTGNDYDYYAYNYSGSLDNAYDIENFDQSGLKYAREHARPPAPRTAADIYFDEAVKAFEARDYRLAIAKFARAGEAAQDDVILPFVYSQALFANEQYTEAAEVLRAAIAEINPQTEGVFYPRGMYSTDYILTEQIKTLNNRANQNPRDLDLQLLLGYQLLGIGELDKAVVPLQNASYDSVNSAAANALLQLLDNLLSAQSQYQK